MSIDDDTIPKKSCSTCRKEFSITTEFFRRKKQRGRFIFYAQCRLCELAEKRIRHWNNREKELAYKHKYYAEHREEICEKARQYAQTEHGQNVIRRRLQKIRQSPIYREQRRIKRRAAYAKNPELYRAKNRENYPKYRTKIIAYQKMYWKNNPEKVRKTSKAWRKANQDKVKAYQQAYVQKHAERRRESVYKSNQKRKPMLRAREKQRRAQKAGAAICDFTAAQWRAMQGHYDHRCVYCGKRCKGKLTQDHIEPLIKGGNHTASNIVPACRPCNSKKNKGPVLKPIQPVLLLWI